MTKLIERELQTHFQLYNAIQSLIPAIEIACQMITGSLQSDKRIFFAGNGGSAADAQHLAAELVGRFRSERKALPAIALTTDTSILTAVANDYGYEHIFVRQLQGLAQPGDVFIGLSTSGNSPNLVRALEYAQSASIKTIGLLGRDGGKMKALCGCPIIIPSQDTARIQEMHILIGHILCSHLDTYPINH